MTAAQYAECERGQDVEPVMSSGLYVLVVVVLLASAFGGYRAVADGRFRGTHRVRGAEPETAQSPGGVPGGPSVLAGTPWEAMLGQRATFVQFSSAFCAPCRTTRRILEGVASETPGVVHVEVDAEHHLDLVRRLGVQRTPTTLVLDGRGREIGRASGAPRREQVRAALPPAAG